MSGVAFPVCWTREFVEETVSTEAVHADRGVFLATHRPLRVKQSSWDGTGTERVVDESHVFEDFLGRRAVGGVVLMPVIGESGTGKSHLVRWVWEHLSATPQRRIVYLPKTGTNLPAVVKALLMDLEGPEFDEIRTRVANSTGQLDPERLPHELLAHLAVAVRFHRSTTSDPARQPLLRMLTSDRGLPALLNDFEYNRHLLTASGVVSRLANEIRRGRLESEQDRPSGFTAADLQPADLRPDDMGDAALRIYQQLLGLPELVECAVEVLNTNLDRAVLDLSGLGSGQLQQAMIDIRREVHRRGQEIVLLVEDFAVIQGVQGDLLDAVSETGVREGRQELATMRTLLAVTPGYYQDKIPETFRTRAAASVPYSYVLDMQIGNADERVDDQHLVDFVGRYLNAARLGANALRDIDMDGVVPNACKGCAVRPRCHEAFGASSDDFGLYPYNKRAVVRAVQLSTPRDSADFNPRRVLGRVIRHVLDNYDSKLLAGEFPSAAFRSEFARGGDGNLSAEHTDYLTRRDPDHARRVPLLEMWGTGTIENLPAAVHEAFRLPALPDQLLTAAPERVAAPAPASAGGRRNRDHDVLGSRLADIEKWHQGATLSQAVANELRQTIRDAVVTHVNWGELGLPTPTAATRRALLADRRGNGVVIEDAFGDRGLDAPSSATVVVRRGPGYATLFQALIERKARGNWDFPGGPEQQRRFMRRLDEWGAAMVAAVRADLGLDRPGTLQAAVEVSLLGGRLLNLDGSQSHTTEKMLNCLFDVGADRAAGAPLYKDEPARPLSWMRVARRQAAERRAVVTTLREIVGVAQGEGGEQVIDVELLRPLLAAVRRTWRATPDLDLPDWVGKAHHSLVADLSGAVAEQCDELRSLCRNVVCHLGNDDPAEVLAMVEEALAAARQAVPGVLKLDPMQIKSDLVRARSFPWIAVRQLSEDLGEDGDDGGESGWARRFALASEDRGPSLADMRTFLQNYRGHLEMVKQRIAQRLTAKPVSPVDELAQLLDQTKQALETWNGADA